MSKRYLEVPLRMPTIKPRSAYAQASIFRSISKHANAKNLKFWHNCTHTGSAKVASFFFKITLLFFSSVNLINAQTTTQFESKNKSITWIQDVDTQVRTAFTQIETGSPAMSNTPRLWLQLANAAHSQFRFVEFTQPPHPVLSGCLVSTDLKIDGNDNQIRNCSRRRQQTKKITLQIDECLRAKEATHFFISNNDKKIICLTHLLAEVPKFNTEKQVTAEGGTQSVDGINARWKPGPRGSHIYLNDAFESAPYWQSHMDPAVARMACMKSTDAVGAYSSRDYWKDLKEPSQYAELTLPYLRWAFVYMVEKRKPIACGKARFFIDHLNEPIAVLPDGTALIQGQQTVLRIRISDGSTGADETLYRKVAAKGFIERMQADGGPNCVKRNKMPCRWIWLRRHPQPAMPEEELYAFWWFQGFDSAVSQIYFKK